MRSDWPFPAIDAVRIAAFVLLAGATAALAEEPAVRDEAPRGSGPDKVRYERDIAPLLARHCVRCHGADRQQGGLRLDDQKRALEGGDSGVAIAAGKSAESPLIARVARSNPDEAMPPEGDGTPLTDAEVALLRRWIDEGADWPERAAGPATSRHWAFQPLRRPAVPALAGVSHPIDAFVRTRLAAEGLSPGSEADRETLLRRLSFDLVGLPPSPEEVREFVADDRPDAYQRLVDRLLASPRFGERWGKHWLDLARYADTDGYSGEQYRPWAWRWRQWVIDAVNADLPFDDFTIQQLAGDLLPGATVEQRVATGFHRNYLHTREMDADKEEFRVRKVVDCANVTGSVWMGLTFACAECHSHKFDPISQREYYGLYAFFNSMEEIDLAAPRPGTPSSGGATASEILAPTLAERETPRPTHIHLRGDFLVRGPAVEPHTPAVLPPLRAGERSTRLDLARWLVSPEHPLTARVAANRVWQHLFGRGLVRTENDFGTQGTPPTHPELLDWLAAELREGEGERGRGGEEERGSRGDSSDSSTPPLPLSLSPPLAPRAWSTKSLIRRIVTSATYRQSAALRPELVERDPDNRLLARQNRLRHEAEVLRDAALSAAGLLDQRVGGPSFRPPVAPDAGAVVATQWKSEPTPERFRRGLYIVVQRTIPLPFLMTFDAPDGITWCTRRERSNTPTQALTLLNDPLFFECAQHLGRRLVREASDEARLKLAYELCFGRAPSAEDRAEMARFLIEKRRLLASQPELAPLIAGTDAQHDASGANSAQEVALWICVARVLMNTDEFLTRE